MRDRALAMAFGFLSGLFFFVEAFLQFALDVFHELIERGGEGLFGRTFGVIPFVFALLVWVFTFIGAPRLRSMEVTSGCVLIVIALLAFLIGGFGVGLFWLLGVVFAVIAGVVFLVAGFSRRIR